MSAPSPPPSSGGAYFFLQVSAEEVVSADAAAVVAISYGKDDAESFRGEVCCPWWWPVPEAVALLVLTVISIFLSVT